MLAGAEGSKPAPPRVTAESARKSLPGQRNRAQQALDTQNETGMWVVPRVASFMGSIGAGFSNHCPRVQAMLSYVEAARSAMGEIEPAYRGDGSLKKMAYPFDDWYELSWQKNAE